MNNFDYFSDLRKNFEAYYNEKLWPKLFELEKERLRQLYRFWILVLIMCIGLPCFIVKMWGEWIYLVFTERNLHNIEAIVRLGLLLVAIIIVVVGYPAISYKNAVKFSVINDFINFFGRFRHRCAKHLSDDLIKKSLLINPYNRHSGDDYFEGTYKDVGMVISEEEMRFKRSKGSSNVFKGIIILLNFPKSFKGQTVVFKDWGLFNIFHKPSYKFEHIKFEDINFEEKFEVYGTDQIEARYLLTTSFMERMLMVRDAFKGKKIQFSFFENQLLIAIESSINMFEPASLFRRSTNRHSINIVLEQFISIFNVVEFLKLTQQ